MRTLSEMYRLNGMPEPGKYDPECSLYFRLTGEQAKSTHLIANGVCTECGTLESLAHEFTCGGVICGEADTNAAPHGTRVAGETFYEQWRKKRRSEVAGH